MRYLVLIGLLTAVVVYAVFGTRGRTSRKPPIEVFGDMDRQPKLRPQADSPFFPDGRTSRLPVPGTIARSTAIQITGKEVFPFEDHPLNTGRVPGTTNYADLNPLPLTEQVMARGQQRFQIYCAPCHGLAGDAKGVTTKFGMTVIADLHDTKTRKVVQQPDGQIFETITYGKNLMGPYGGIIPAEDRWAIIHYVRALQRSRLATIEDVPAGDRMKLPAGTVPAAATAPAAPGAAAPKPTP